MPWQDDGTKQNARFFLNILNFTHLVHCGISNAADKVVAPLTRPATISPISNTNTNLSFDPLTERKKRKPLAFSASRCFVRTRPCQQSEVYTRDTAKTPTRSTHTANAPSDPQTHPTADAHRLFSPSGSALDELYLCTSPT